MQFGYMDVRHHPPAQFPPDPGLPRGHADRDHHGGGDRAAHHPALGQPTAGADGLRPGLKLFEPERGRLRPTREARDLFEEVERHFLGLGRIEQRVAILRRAGAGTLRIGSTPALGLSVLPRAIAALRRQHPEVHVSLHTHGGHQLWEGLHNGAFDLVLSTTPSSMAPATASALHRATVVCVMHPEHPLAGRRRLHARDLRASRRC